MKKILNSPSSNKVFLMKAGDSGSNTAIPSNNSNPNDVKQNIDLASIFHKIAVFEEEKLEWDYLESVKESIDEKLKQEIIELSSQEFQRISGVTSDSTNEVMTSFTELAEENVKKLIGDKINDLTIMEQKLFELAKRLKLLCCEENRLLIDRARLMQAIETTSNSSQILQDVCRNQQKRNKTAFEDFELLCAEEASRTESIERSCEESIREVIASVEKEEKLVADKEKENLDLRAKIEEFRNHLAYRQQQTEAYQKAKELQMHLTRSKKEEIEKSKHQNQTSWENYLSSLNQQKEKVNTLENQVKIYAAKFSDFDHTLKDTKILFTNVENRGREIALKAFNIEQRNQKVFSKAEARQRELENLLNEKLRLDEEYRSLQNECATEESICRDKLSVRAGLLRQVEIARKEAARYAKYAKEKLERYFKTKREEKIKSATDTKVNDNGPPNSSLECFSIVCERNSLMNDNSKCVCKSCSQSAGSIIFSNPTTNRKVRVDLGENQIKELTNERSQSKGVPSSSSSSSSSSRRYPTSSVGYDPDYPTGSPIPVTKPTNLASAFDENTPIEKDSS